MLQKQELDTFLGFLSSSKDLVWSSKMYEIQNMAYQTLFLTNRIDFKLSVLSRNLSRVQILLTKEKILSRGAFVQDNRMRIQRSLPIP